MNKKKALFEFLKDTTDIESIDEIAGDLEDSYFESPYGDYNVYTDEEAREAAYNSVKDLTDELGFDTFSDNVRKYIVTHYLDFDALKDLIHNDLEEEYNEYSEEELLDAAERQAYDLDSWQDADGNIDPDDYEDLREALIEDEFKNCTGSDNDIVEYLEMMFGEEWYKEMWANGYVDWGAAITYCLYVDGFGPTLASYDGEENYIEDPDTGEDYFIYRVN